jgi:glucose-6-phosphate 1-dehydrogenase
MMAIPHADALVFFGATGDLAYKKIYPSLQAMVKRGTLGMPVIGVANAGWDTERLRARARDSLEQHGSFDTTVFDKLAGLLRYVDGDYNDPATFRALRGELGSAKSPAHYLAIPPFLFETVVRQLGATGCAENARVIVEKPFGINRASARELNRILLEIFPEEAVFRMDHFLGKRPIRNMLYFRFANTFFESFWNRNYIESIQMTMAEDFGVEGRGAFYDATGAIRDVVQNHLFQLLANLTMEPPVRTDSESIRDEKVKVLKAIPPIEPNEVARGQFKGYRTERGVAPNSTVETFAALELQIDSWRWQRVPIYIRTGKRLPVTCTEVVIRLRKPPTMYTESPLIGNHLRFRVSPDVSLGLGLMVMAPGEGMVGQAAEMIGIRQPRADEADAYERVISDAIVGDTTLFARADYVDEAWRIVEPILEATSPIYEYESRTWGPREVDSIVSPPGGWHNPLAAT